MIAAGRDQPRPHAAAQVGALVDVFERDRARLAVSGLADLDTAVDRPEVVDEALRFVTPHLADTRRSATPIR